VGHTAEHQILEVHAVSLEVCNHPVVARRKEDRVLFPCDDEVRWLIRLVGPTGLVNRSAHHDDRLHTCGPPKLLRGNRSSDSTVRIPPQDDLVAIDAILLLPPAAADPPDCSLHVWR